MTERYDERLERLEGHVAQLEMIQQLLLRLLSVIHPLSNVLAQYGATATQEQALLEFLDELADRVRGLERRPSFDYFQSRVSEILPALAADRDFLVLLIDTLRVERAAYRQLHEYMAGQGWPLRVEQRTTAV